LLKGPHVAPVCHSTRESSTCLAAVANGTLRPPSNALVPFAQVACPAHMGHCLHSANPDLICLPLVFFHFLQPPLLPTRPARRLCFMAPLSVCVRPTTCCWATSASTGPPTCLQEQCPTRCPSPTGAAVAVAAGEWRLLIAVDGVIDDGGGGGSGIVEGHSTHSSSNRVAPSGHQGSLPQLCGVSEGTYLPQHVDMQLLSQCPDRNCWCCLPLFALSLQGGSCPTLARRQGGILPRFTRGTLWGTSSTRQGCTAPTPTTRRRTTTL
jgi:hypothetical protein